MKEQLLLRALLALKDGNPTEWNRLVEQCADINNREFTVYVVILILLLTVVSVLLYFRLLPKEKLEERGIDSEILEILIIVLSISSIIPFIGAAINYCDAAAPWIGLLTPVMKT